MDRSTSPSSIAGRAVLLAGAVLAALVLSGGVEPVELLSPAREGQGSEVILEDFGPEGIREEDPFDGQYIYVTARLFPDLDEITDQIYESDYRLVRILHPVLASPAPAGTPTVLLLEAWNLVGLGLLAASLASLLARHGHDPGVAIGASVAACAIPLLMTTSEPLAFGLGMVGLWLVDRDRVVWALVPLALAGLTRESALTFAVACAVLLWTRTRRPAALGLLAAAATPMLVWRTYVQSITTPSRVPLDPFGVIHIGDQIWSDILASVVMFGLIAVSVVAWWDVPPLRWLAVAFAAWLPLYEREGFELIGLPRLSLPSIALGIAGLVRWRAQRERRADTGPEPGGSDRLAPEAR